MPDGRTRRPPRDLAPGVMTEYLDRRLGHSSCGRRAQYEKFRSPFQAIEVHDTRSFGKLFRLDGHFMTSEKDEFFYHENLVHICGDHASHRRRRR